MTSWPPVPEIRPDARPGTRVLVIYGMARTKKNRPIMTRAGYNQTGRAVLLPNKEWVAWAKDAPLKYAGEWPTRPMTQQVNCAASFYLTPRQGGDALGYYEGLADLLQDRGVLLNDKLIVQWDRSRLLVDAAHPRVEVELEPVPLTL